MERWRKAPVPNEPSYKTLTPCGTRTYGIIKWIRNPNEPDGCRIVPRVRSLTVAVLIVRSLPLPALIDLPIVPQPSTDNRQSTFDTRRSLRPSVPSPPPFPRFGFAAFFRLPRWLHAFCVVPRCDTHEKTVLAKRSHLTPLLYRFKSRRRAAREDQRGRPAPPWLAYHVMVAGNRGDSRCRRVPPWYPLPRALIQNQFAQRRIMAT